MIARKSLSVGSLRESMANIPTVIKSEDLEIVNSYDGYILQKTIEADAIIDGANETAKRVVNEAKEEAEVEFWQQAQSIFEEMATMQQAILENIEEHCNTVVTSALQKLLEDVPSEEKIRPIIKTLLAENVHDEPAVVLCHPEQEALVTELLEGKSIPVKVDETLELDSITLKTDKNRFKSSFNGKLKALTRALRSC